MTCRVYLAGKMTGLTAQNITDKYNVAIEAMWKEGLEVVSPWDREVLNYPPHKIVRATVGDLERMWRKDKKEIESCHVLCDIDGDKFSRGTAMEVGFMRYHLMRPVVFVEPELPTSIRTFEGDHLALNVQSAARLIRSKWETWAKRVGWRLRTVYNPTVMLRRYWRLLRGWM